MNEWIKKKPIGSNKVPQPSAGLSIWTGDGLNKTRLILFWIDSKICWIDFAATGTLKPDDDVVDGAMKNRTKNITQQKKNDAQLQLRR